jgi:predicted MPP superfamily phosphohydrolase
MTKDETRERQIDFLDLEFHDYASELMDALAFAHSMESEGRIIDSFGKAVTIARRMIAADDKLAELGAAHEPRGKHQAGSVSES